MHVPFNHSLLLTVLGVLCLSQDGDFKYWDTPRLSSTSDTAISFNQVNPLSDIYLEMEKSEINVEVL